MTYKVIIIEDEPPAAKRLSKMLIASPYDIEIIKILDSVEDSVNYLCEHSQYDLILMDVQLGDGLSFEIFESVQITRPIIFTTAYDDYALQAFKVNSVDYLLKPISQEELDNALHQYVDRRKDNEHPLDFSHLLNSLKKPDYKHRFLVKKGKQMMVIPVQDAQYMYSEDGYSFLVDRQGGKHLIEGTIDQICNSLDPAQYHRINRKMIVSINSLGAIHDYFNSRLKITLVPDPTFEVIVSRERVRGFKQWLGDG